MIDVKRPTKMNDAFNPMDPKFRINISENICHLNPLGKYEMAMITEQEILQS